VRGAPPGKRFEDDVERLRIAVTALAQNRGLRGVTLLGQRPRAGTTTVAVWLARSLARESRPTLLLDFNFKNPRLHEVFQVGAEPGVLDVLEGRAGVDEAVRPTSDPNLKVLPHGNRTLSTNPSIEQCRTLMSGLQTDRFVVADGGSAGAPGALAMAAASGVALVLKAGDATRQDIEAIRNRLSRNGTELLGVVVNQRRHFIPGVIYRYL